MASSLSDPRLATARRTSVPDVRVTWRQALFALAAVEVAILLLYGGTVGSMVRTWANSETFAHGFVVLPIVLWLAWRNRGALATLQPRPAPWALAGMAIAGLVWLAARLAEVNVVAQFSMTALLDLAVIAVLGTNVARKLTFPLAFLFFAVPFGDVFLPVLMDWTANFTVAALRLSGIPVYKDGLVFVIPSGTWSVIEACSGVRYLIASLMVGTLYAYLTYRSNRRRWIFIAFSALVPIVANWVRAYLIVLIGHLSNNHLAVGIDHIIYGWIFFAFVILVMFWIGGRWREDGPDAPATVAVARGTGAAPSRIWMTAVAAIVVCGAFPLAQAQLDARDAAGEPRPASIAPAAGWREAQGGLTPWQPVFEGASARYDGHFTRGGASVGLYIAYYRNQDPQHRLVSSTNVLARSEDHTWRQVDTGRLEGVAVGDATTPVKTANVLYARGGRLVTWRFYWIDGHLLASDTRAKLVTALARLRSGRDDAAEVIAYVPADDEKAAASVLRVFLADEGRAILAALDGTRERR
jgi:exosortase A